jgi:DUF4097 and DUF4098 domain-containing protein YvlB
MSTKWMLPFTAVMLTISTAGAQPRNSERSLSCGDNGRGSDRQQRFCEMREYPQPAAPRVIADGRTNGGISVKAWDRSDMLVRAKVESWAPTEGEARTIAGQINLQTAAGNIRADAPEFGRDRGWAVSYEIFVPQRTDLSLKAHNGGVSITEVRGNIEFEAVNGGVNLKRLAGNVHGKTVNGGVNVELAGTRWDGNELNVSATNGGVNLAVPENYSARLETATVNGRVAVDFPVSVQGRIDRELSVNLGSGGPLIRATTTNGGVSIRRKS